MELSIKLSPEAERRLREKAAASGMDLSAFAAETLERVARRASLEEVLAPLRDEFQQSGLDDEALVRLLERAKHQLRVPPTGSGAG